MVMEGIGVYICMLEVIYIYRQFGTMAANVSINQNITGLVGNADTDLTCSFFLESDEMINSVQIIAKNMTEDVDVENPIAIFQPNRMTRLHPLGEYLFGRVTLTNITDKSTNATLTFNMLKRIDENSYMCKCYYNDKYGTIKYVKSDATRILVKVPISDVHINKQPNQRQYDRKTNNIILTCKASGDPEPEYAWFKEANNSNIISKTNLYFIEGIVQNNSGVYICEAYNFINNVKHTQACSVEIVIVEEKLTSPESASSENSSVHTAYAISFTCTVVVIVLCFAVRKRYFIREKRNIHSEVSDDQENISVANEYEEIESDSYHEVNLHNDRIETSIQPSSEEEIVLENIPISTCTSSNESNITFSHLYVNTDIFNTNENRKMSANNETISDHSNGYGNCNIGVDNTFVSDNSGSDTHHVYQYVNMTSVRVPNVYEDLNHTTANTHKYESLN